MILRNCCSATSMPAAVQRLRMSPSRQRFTLRWVERTISIIDSHGLVEHSVLASWPVIPSPISVNVSAMPCLSEAAASGQDLLELAGEQPLLGELGICQRPRRPHAGANLVAVALG